MYCLKSCLCAIAIIFCACRLHAAEPEAPAITPELLMVTRVGGTGDQWLRQVFVQGQRIVALGEKDFSVQVTVGENDSVKGAITGNINAEQKNIIRGIS